MAHNKLSARTVETKAKPGRYGDGGGLLLQVSKWGTKSWIFRYERDGREHHMGLGSTDTRSLAGARERARDCRRLLLDGRDPIETRNAERARRRIEAARGVTFKDCAEQHLAAHQAGWRNGKHRAQWSSTLATYAYPIVGGLPVTAIDTALVMKCIGPIWQTKPETAKRVRGRIESVLDFATVRGFRHRDNPARWRGHLDKLLPTPGKVRAVKHHAAVRHAELPGFMAELRGRDGVAARALEITVLTASRTGEVIGARRAEFDLAAKVWTVPAARMKAERDHRAPLSARDRDTWKAAVGRRVRVCGRSSRPAAVEHGHAGDAQAHEARRREARVAYETAQRQFKRFQSTALRAAGPKISRLPRYGGPDWIGKAAPS